MLAIHLHVQQPSHGLCNVLNQLSSSAANLVQHLADTTIGFE